jgi:hypothetical protein
MRFTALALALAIIAPAASLAQGYPYPYPRTRRTGKATNAPPPSGMPTPTMEGTLKMMSSKEITLQLQSDQLVTIRRDHKTKFFDNDKEVKPDKIAVGTPLAIDVKEDLDLKPLAVRVVANPPPPKSDEKSSAQKQ